MVSLLDPDARGRVILVGAGPGDPGLLTLRAVEALRAADIVVHDGLIDPSILDHAPAHAQRISVAKQRARHTLPQSAINALIVAHVRAGSIVVRLKGGDPFVFGRGGEEVDECVLAGITVNVIPGVSSAIAAPAVAMTPATHRGLTQGFTVISGHVPPGDPESTVNYAALAQANTTIVLMMAVANLDAITSALIDAGMSVQTPATAVIDAVAGFVPGRTANLPAVELNVR
jgi:uroporphyrin-III C-methyltransferase